MTSSTGPGPPPGLVSCFGGRCAPRTQHQKPLLAMKITRSRSAPLALATTAGPSRTSDRALTAAGAARPICLPLMLMHSLRPGNSRLATHFLAGICCPPSLLPAPAPRARRAGPCPRSHNSRSGRQGGRLMIPRPNTCNSLQRAKACAFRRPSLSAGEATRLLPLSKAVGGTGLLTSREADSQSRGPRQTRGSGRVKCLDWYGMVWYGMVWYGMVWYGMVWYGMVWGLPRLICFAPALCMSFPLLLDLSPALAAPPLQLYVYHAACRRHPAPPACKPGPLQCVTGRRADFGACPGPAKE
jgi:hypothetical protein